MRSAPGSVGSVCPEGVGAGFGVAGSCCSGSGNRGAPRSGGVRQGSEVPVQGGARGRVPIRRSQTAFICGSAAGVVMTCSPSALEHLSGRGGEQRIAVVDQEPQWSDAVAQAMSGCGPLYCLCPGRVRGQSAQV